VDDDLTCPRCQSDEHLRGDRDGEVIHADNLARVLESNTPLPPEDNPAAGMR
jgi:hypothetical protein